MVAGYINSATVAQTEDIPQADSLASLRDVVQAVAAGAVTTPEIEAAARLTHRQARYYLLAARTLGWLELGPARPLLTAAGKVLLALKPGGLDESDAIAAAINSSPVLEASVGRYLHEEKVDRAVLVGRLLASTELSLTTARRRAASLVGWRFQLLDRGWRPERIQSAPERQSTNLPIENLSVPGTGRLAAPWH